jgi:hypothetical protein
VLRDLSERRHGRSESFEHVLLDDAPLRGASNGWPERREHDVSARRIVSGSGSGIKADWRVGAGRRAISWTISEWGAETFIG